MARKLPTGTPTRSAGYVFPHRSRRPLWVSLGAGGALAAALTLLYFAGLEGALSPGPVAAHHAPIGDQCILCHATGSAVEDLRCERCHDLEGSSRMTNAAHVLFGSADPRKAADAESVACLTCHTEHRGRAHELAAVDDRECASCHQFSTLRAHPEFAARQAQITTGLGLKFPHDRHIVDVRNRTGSDCQACHAPTRDLRGFEPISFELHCAACHTDGESFVNGKSDTLLREHLLPPDRVPPPWNDTRVEIASVGPPRFGRAEVTRMRHRDPWVAYNALALRRSIDPEADAAEQAALRSQLAWLEQQQGSRPLGTLARPQLVAWVAIVQDDVRTLEERLAASGGDGTEYLAHRMVTIEELAGQLATAGLVPEAGQDSGEAERQALAESIAELSGLLASLSADVAEQPLAPEPPASPDELEEPQERFERRRREIVGVLDAIADRGYDDLAERADRLRERVEDLEYAESGHAESEAGADDVQVLQAQLEGLDEVFRAIAATNDPGAQLEAARIDLLRGLARQRVGQGLAAEEFELRRSEVLELLDAVQERADDDDLGLRVADLRQRAIALRPGDAGADDLRRRRRQKQRLLERLRLELELEDAGVRVRPVAAGSMRDQASIGAEIASIRARLDELRRGPRPAALGPEDRMARRESLGALLAPCLKCHELGGSRLAPVRIAEPVMTRALFDHAPHVTQVGCDVCHGRPASGDPATGGGATGVYASKNASDLNSPGVVNCRGCHQPAAVDDDCEVCHRYHPLSLSTLLRLQ